MESAHDSRNRFKNWVKSVKIGDIVCDCRYFHQRVIALRNTYSEEPWSKGMRWQEKEVVLEDGSSCSLYHCANAGDHKWPHPTKSQIKQNLGDFWTDAHERMYKDWPEN